MKKLARKNILPIKAYVPGKPVSEVKREFGLEKVIKLASNENPLGASPKAIEAVKKAVETMNIYPDGYAFDIKEKLASYFDVEMENLIFGDGTDEVLEMLFLAYVKEDDEVIFGDPSFVEYSRYTQITGGTAVKIPMDKEHKLNLNELFEKINEKTKMIMICNPNNPTGTMNTIDEVEEFIKKVPEDVLVVFDEAYYEYAMNEENYPNSLDYQKKGYKNIITLRTFSKAYGLAGLRIGYGIADQEIIEMLEKIRLPFNVTSLSQAGAIAAIDDIEHLESSIRVNDEGKKYLYLELDRLNIKYTKTYANYIYMNVGRSGIDLFNQLLAKGIIVRAMAGDFIRVTIGTQDENEAFIKELEGVMK